MALRLRFTEYVAHLSVVNIGTDPIGVWPYDTMEFYTAGASVSGLNSGWAWASAYTDVGNGTYTIANDTMETYVNGITVNGLNDGSGFNGTYADRTSFFAIFGSDTMETYVNGGTLSGTTNDGFGFTGAFVSH
jgi:hypothetical protein